MNIDAKRLTFRQKLFYGMGEISITLSGTVVGLLYVFFLTNVVGLRASLAGLVFLIGSLWDGVNDPIMGYITDITRSRFGRRRIYFLVTSIPFALSFFLLWTVPNAGEMAIFAYALVSYLLYCTVTTLFIIPYTAYGMEIEKGYDGRTTLQSFKFFFSILFGLVAAALPEMITTIPLDPAIPQGMPSRMGYILMAGIFALPMCIGSLTTFFAFKEPGFNNAPRANLLKKSLAVFKNRHFVKALGIYMCSWAAIDFIQFMLIYFLSFVLGQGDNFALIAVIIMGTATLCLPVWVWISKKLDKRRAYILGMAICAVFFTALLLPAPVLNTIIWGLLPFIGFGLSAMHMLPGAIIPEAIEAGQKDGEEANVGVYYGMVTFSQRLGVAVMVQIATIVMEWSGFKSTEQGQVITQPFSAVMCIQVLFSLVPVGCMIAGILLARRFEIGRAESLELHQQLDT